MRTWTTPEGIRASSTTSVELEAREREATLRIRADRYELQAQAPTRLAAVLAVASPDLAAVAELHSPTTMTSDPGVYVGCEGCDYGYDGEPEWPCRTFALVERRALTAASSASSRG